MRYVSPDATIIPAITASAETSAGTDAPVELDAAFRSKYRLQTLLGSGAFGAVYRAVRLHDGVTVAIKFLLRAESAESLARFLREARLMAQMQHPAILRCFDADQMSGHPYLVTEYMPGGSLKDRLARGKPSAAEALDLIQTLLGGLAACHASGIIHRDIKPGNILIDEHHGPRLADLGLAVNRSSDDTILTMQGQIMGTLRYASPEQLLGEPATPASDVFSVAVVLYEMIAGRTPYEPKNVARAIVDLQAGSYTRLSTLVPATLRPVAEVVDRALSCAAAARPRDAAEMAKQLVEAGASRAVVPATEAATVAMPSQLPVYRRPGAALDDPGWHGIVILASTCFFPFFSGNLMNLLYFVVPTACVALFKMVPYRRGPPRDEPAVVLSDEGVHDRRWGFGPIPWSSIKSAQTWKGTFFSGIRLHVTEIDSHLAPLGLLESLLVRMLFVEKIEVSQYRDGRMGQKVWEALLLIEGHELDTKDLDLVKEIQSRIGAGFRKTGRSTRNLPPAKPS